MCSRILQGAYAKRDIAMQLHFASIRDNNGMMFAKLGPDTGYDASHDKELAASLSAFLNNLSGTGEVPRPFSIRSIQRITIRW
jgi:glucuronate isomerase